MTSAKKEKAISALAANWRPTADVAREAGHKPQSPPRAIGDKCLDCSCQQVREVRPADNQPIEDTREGAPAARSHDGQPVRH